MEVPPAIYPSGDPILIDTIVGQLKSQGTFDQFRKECVADVDTKPAYQNLHQRVETAVAKFLEGQKWRPDMNKNQLRDSLRKHIHELGFLEAGVERIVDQVVNPKVHAVFMPQVEDVVYRVQGIPKPDKKPLPTTAPSSLGSGTQNGGIFTSSLFSQPPPFLPGLSFLPPALQSHMQKPPPTLADLLPTDLDPVSPESSKGSVDEADKVKEPEVNKEHDESLDSQLSGISDLTSHGSDHEISSKEVKTDVPNAQIANEDSHLSKVSSNSRLSFTSSDDKSQGTKERNTEETDEIEENQQSVNPAISKMSNSPIFQHGNDTSFKTPPHEPAEESILQYENQFSKEEEVATTVTAQEHEMFATSCPISEESLPDTSPKGHRINSDIESNNVEEVNNDFKINNTDVINNHVESSNAEGDHVSASKDEEIHSDFGQDDCLKNLPNKHFPMDEADDICLHHSEESQSSDASENKLQIDEMKDSNSHSEQSIQNFDQVVLKEPPYERFESKDGTRERSPSENIVEASEEARHGFDDSQDALERPSMPSPSAPPSDSLSPKSNSSFPCEENGIPKTPRWQPMSPEVDGTKMLAVSAPSEDPNFQTSQVDDQAFLYKSNTDLDDVSQSGSEDMQLAWSPLSVHENKDDDDSGSKTAFDGKDLTGEVAFERKDVSSNTAIEKEGFDVDSEQQMKECVRQDRTDDLKTHHQSKESSDRHDDHHEKHKTKDKCRDEQGKERSKDEDHSRKESSSSSKRHDERSSSRHKDGRERKDSSSRSKHDDKTRSDRDRSSSHHKSDEKRKGDRERSSSSKHKASRPEERHRHKDRDSKSHGSSREDKEKSSSSKERSSTKSHSSDRDRRDRDKKEKEGKDKEKRLEKDRDRSGSKHRDKRREKEKDKGKKEKNSNVCRPTNERRSPDPDSNNGSTFGGSQTTGASSCSATQPKGNNQDESNKDASPTDSDSKSSDSSQSKGLSAELSNASSASPPSSLPFKKRPLQQDSSEIDESYGRLILRIKKVKLDPSYYKQGSGSSSKGERRSQTKHPSVSEENQSSLAEVQDCRASSTPNSPFLYFESDWPTKADDEAFCSYVNRLEQSENLSDISDHSGSEIEHKVHGGSSSYRAYSVSQGVTNYHSVSALSKNQGNEYFESKSCEKDVRMNLKKGKGGHTRRDHDGSYKVKTKQKQSFGNNGRKTIKFRKESSFEPQQNSPVLFKSRRERKPNKRYSNEEFTSSFGYEDDETEENYSLPLKSHVSSMDWKSNCEDDHRLTGVNETSMLQESGNTFNERDSVNPFGSEHEIAATQETTITSSTHESENERKGSSYSWKKEEVDSNSEDENDTSGYENELIGTALKNLMMESGLGRPEEACGSDRIPSASQSSKNSTEFGTTKKLPLSGVKRVGLSRKYRAKTNFSAQTTNKIVSSKSPTREEFPLPPSPESDVSASSVEKGRMGKAKKAVLGVVVSDAESNGDLGGLTHKKSDRVKQHYNSDELYKPRPVLRFTSKRRQVVADHDGVW